MKKNVVIFLLMVLGSCALWAQQDCGAIDCPGRCGRFVDSNGDGFCDHGRLSIPTQEDNTPNTMEVSNLREEATQPEAASENSRIEQHRQQMTQHHQTTANHKIDDNSALTPDKKNETSQEVAPAPAANKSPYSLILISALTLGLYAISFILVKTKVLKKTTHRKIWNVLLLITGLASCLLGFFLVIQINYNLKMDWLWTVKLYHVQFGIAMTIIAIIHILWHWNYWKSIVKK